MMVNKGFRWMYIEKAYMRFNLKKWVYCVYGCLTEGKCEKAKGHDVKSGTDVDVDTTEKVIFHFIPKCIH